MSEYLVFTLTATFGAMGELAGHERRGSWDWPGRSAIIGLLGAALGIRRDGDFSELDRLALAVAVFDTGVALRDYQTVQTVPTAKAKQPPSRPLALSTAKEDLNTIITQRDYRVSALYGVAVTGDGLEPIQEALRQPVFSLYLGRKSCPLSAPLAPQIINSTSVESAIAKITPPPWYREQQLIANRLYTDIPGLKGERSETRHDMPLDRRLWHFTERRFQVFNVDIRAGALAE